MSKEVKITINREDRTQTLDKELYVEQAISEHEGLEGAELSEEDLYAKEFELVLEEYIKFTQAYKEVSKQMMNPLKMRKNAGKIYEDLNRLSQRFNRVIDSFEDRATPPADLKEIHEETLDCLDHFYVYNEEFPELMVNGDFKRINKLSKGLEKGHKGIQRVFDRLEKYEESKAK